VITRNRTGIRVIQVVKILVEINVCKRKRVRMNIVAKADLFERRPYFSDAHTMLTSVVVTQRPVM
jgi:hypothetical protein